MKHELTGHTPFVEGVEQETEQIIGAIIEAAPNVPSRNGNATFFELSYGNKNLELVYFREKGVFATSLVADENKDKKPEETRLLYMAAKRLMQKITDREQKELPYTLETYDEKMIRFAQTHGQNIFEWDVELEKKLWTKRGELFIGRHSKKLSSRILP